MLFMSTMVLNLWVCFGTYITYVYPFFNHYFFILLFNQLKNIYYIFSKMVKERLNAVMS